MKSILKIFLFLITFVMFTSCAVIPLDFGEVESVKMLGIEQNKMKFEVAVPITNPNKYSIKIVDVNLEIFNEGQLIGHVINGDNYKFPAQSTATQIFAFEFEMPDLLTGGLTLMKFYTQKNAVINVKGTITAKNFLYRKKIKIDENFPFKLNRK